MENSLDYLSEEAILRDCTIRTKKSPTFKKLKRNYKIPPGYTDYNQVIFDICLIAPFWKSFTNGQPLDRNDYRPFYEANTFLMLLEKNEPAVYCLTPKLLEAIELTDLPSSLPGLEQTIPFGILLLPETLTESGEQHGMTYILFSFFGLRDPLPKRDRFLDLSPPEQKDWRAVRWLAVNSHALAYSEELGIEPNGTVHRFSNHSGLWTEPGFMSRLTSVVVQSLYLIQEQKLVTADDRLTAAKSRGETKMPKSQAVRYPRYLGRDFTMQGKSTKRVDIDYPTSRHSPIAHIRRGHRKIVWHGKGKTEQKTVWIAPCWVGD